MVRSVVRVNCFLLVERVTNHQPTERRMTQVLTHLRILAHIDRDAFDLRGIADDMHWLRSCVKEFGMSFAHFRRFLSGQLPEDLGVDDPIFD